MKVLHKNEPACQVMMAFLFDITRRNVVIFQLQKLLSKEVHSNESKFSCNCSHSRYF